MVSFITVCKRLLHCSGVLTVLPWKSVRKWCCSEVRAAAEYAQCVPLCEGLLRAGLWETKGFCGRPVESFKNTAADSDCKLASWSTRPVYVAFSVCVCLKSPVVRTKKRPNTFRQVDSCRSEEGTKFESPSETTALRFMNRSENSQENGIKWKTEPLPEGVPIHTTAVIPFWHRVKVFPWFKAFVMSWVFSTRPSGRSSLVTVTVLSSTQCHPSGSVDLGRRCGISHLDVLQGSLMLTLLCSPGN